MITFRRRRYSLITITTILAVIIFQVYYHYRNMLFPMNKYTGYLLLGMVFFLAAYNVRKKLPFLPLGKSSTWLQIHIYTALSTVLLYFLHTNWRIPKGSFEIILGVLFLIVAFSGLIGLYISRTFPEKLTSRGGAVTFEKIPQLRHDLHQKARDIVFRAISDSKKPTLADFYVFALDEYFSRPQNFSNHLFNADYHLAKLYAKVDGVKRYLSISELEAMEELEVLIREKNDLDFQYVSQGVLKFWFFAHIPLTYSLLIFAVVHAVITIRFLGV